jgi:hypothetical protein
MSVIFTRVSSQGGGGHQHSGTIQVKRRGEKARSLSHGKENRRNDG